MAKLAAFDMDGTLLMPNHQLGAETLNTLKRLQDGGIVLAFATGRHHIEMRHIAAAIDLKAYLITGNGTRVHDINDKAIWRRDLPPGIVEHVLHGHWNTRASLHIFNDKGWFTQHDDPALLNAHAFSGFNYQLTDLRRLPAWGVAKICFCGEHADLRQLRVQLNEVLDDSAHACFSAPGCLEILPADCHKGAALAALCDHLSLSLDECMAFGDAMNDREMLSGVGHGLIMGNAMPELRASLPHLPVIGHCQRQAVSHYLTHWLDTPHLTYSPE